MSRPGRGVRAAGCLLLPTVIVLAGACTSEGGTPQLREAADLGYVAGDGTIAVVPRPDRDDPVEIAGETLDGEPVDLSDLRGRAVVVNIWWSDCPPCRAESPDLVAAHDELAGQDVTFVGLNIRDVSTTNAKRFEDSYDIPYESLYDPDGDLLLDLRGVVPPNAVPSTLVLDRNGAVAARVIGRIDSATTLVTLVSDVLAEPAAQD